MNQMVPLTCSGCGKVRQIAVGLLKSRVTDLCRECWMKAVKSTKALPGRRKTADCKCCTHFIPSHYGYPPRCNRIITKTGVFQTIYKIDRCPLPVEEAQS